MRFEILYSSSALDDIEDIYNYTSITYGAIKARQVTKELINRIKILSSFPYAFPKITKKCKQDPYYIMTIKPFVVFYNVKENEERIEILSIMKSSRK